MTDERDTTVVGCARCHVRPAVAGGLCAECATTPDLDAIRERLAEYDDAQDAYNDACLRNVHQTAEQNKTEHAALIRLDGAEDDLAMHAPDDIRALLTHIDAQQQRIAALEYDSKGHHNAYAELSTAAAALRESPGFSYEADDLAGIASDPREVLVVAVREMAKDKARIAALEDALREIVAEPDKLVPGHSKNEMPAWSGEEFGYWGGLHDAAAIARRALKDDK